MATSSSPDKNSASSPSSADKKANLRQNKQAWLDLVAGKEEETQHRNSTTTPHQRPQVVFQMNEKEAYTYSRHGRDCESSLDDSLFTSNSSTDSISKGASLYSDSTKNIRNGQKADKSSEKIVPQTLYSPTFTPHHQQASVETSCPLETDSKDSESLSSSYLLDGPILSLMDPNDSLLDHRLASTRDKQDSSLHATTMAPLAKKAAQLSIPHNETDSDASSSGHGDLQKAFGLQKRKRSTEVTCCGHRIPLTLLMILAFSLLLFLCAFILIISQVATGDSRNSNSVESDSLSNTRSNIPSDWNTTSVTNQGDVVPSGEEDVDTPSDTLDGIETARSVESQAPSTSSYPTEMRYQSFTPSFKPSGTPSLRPTVTKSNPPSMTPSHSPSSSPSSFPSSNKPTNRPSISPTLNPFHQSIASTRLALDTIFSTLNSWNNPMLTTQEVLYATLDDVYDNVHADGTANYEDALLDAQTFLESVKQFEKDVKDANRDMAKALKNDFKVLENEAGDLVRLLQDTI